MYQLKRRDVVCLDSNVIIWGIVHEADRNNQSKIEKARHLIETCSKLDVSVVIPSIALAEVISGCKDAHRAAELRAEMFKRFRIATFDAMAAYHYSLLWQKKKAQKNCQVIANERRNTLKADCMIIATAIAVKSKCIFTGNKEVKVFRNLAPEELYVTEPPGFSKQTSLMGPYE